ncbi:MAG: hypothetical protein JNM57_05145 [Cyclobacteriaceae bacterium]|nr:hypothetical protein [Cyclobacteriaceae bacterium]
MKSLKYSIYIITLLIAGACEQEVIDLQPPVVVEDNSCATAASGTADFTKFVALGSSYTAGFQAGALFTEGQNNSLAKILSTQFACAGGGAFNQPTIGNEFGYNIFISPNPPADNQIRGRLFLQGTPPAPAPHKFALGDLSAAPNPAINPGFMYTGSTGAVPSNQLNNFSVQAVFLGQALIPQTGNWAVAGVDPRFNPFYGRFASNPGTSTMLTDAIGSLTNGGTFFLFWLGMDDVLLHAAFGGDPTKAPLTPLDFVDANNPGFKILYNNAIGGLLANPTLEGVVANYPEIFTMPHFTSVPYNPIPLPAETAASLTTNVANNYNAFLDYAVANGFISEDEGAKRKIEYKAGQNPILFNDETLTDLAPNMVGPFAGLAPYAKARQTKNTDIIPLSTGSVLGVVLGPNLIQGVTVPLGDQYVLIPSEITEINTRLADFNAHVKSVADANSTRLAFADVNKAMKDFVTAKAYVIDNVTITPSLAPPTGIYSEEGLHPNSRGYAFIARTFIDAINTKFGSTIPKPKLGNYKATALPINP